jgi:hypothetical protein
VDCLVANNVIDSPQNWVFRILQETTSTLEYEFLPASNGRFINNIVYFDGLVGVAVNVGPDTDPDSFVIATNLWYRYDNPATSDPPGGLPVVEQGGIIGLDPMFVDAAAGDFHLDPASPAVAAGTPLAELSGDYDGVCFADPPAIGAKLQPGVGNPRERTGRNQDPVRSRRPIRDVNLAPALACQPVAIGADGNV